MLFKKLLCVSILLVGTLLFSYAETNAVEIAYSDGRIDYILMNRNVVSFYNNDSLYFRTDDIEFSCKLSNKVKVQFVDTKESNIPVVRKQEIRFSIHGNIILLEGLKEGESVVIVDMTGKIRDSSKADDSGTGKIRIDNNGVYLLRTETCCYKIKYYED